MELIKTLMILKDFATCLVEELWYGTSADLLRPQLSTELSLLSDGGVDRGGEPLPPLLPS